MSGGLLGIPVVEKGDRPAQGQRVKSHFSVSKRDGDIKIKTNTQIHIKLPAS